MLRAGGGVLSLAQSSAAPVCGTVGSVALLPPHRQTQCNDAGCQTTLLTVEGVILLLCTNDSGDPRFGRGPITFWATSSLARKYAMSGIETWRSGRVQAHKEDLDAFVVVCLR